MASQGKAANDTRNNCRVSSKNEAALVHVLAHN